MIMPDKRDAQGDLPRTARPDWRVRQPRRLLRQKIEPSRKEDSGRKQGLGRVAIRRHLEVLYKIGHRDQRGVRERKLFLDSLQSLSLLQTGYTGWHPAISHAVRQAGRSLFAGALAGSLIMAARSTT